MERETWTSERLDDLATGMREGFARVDQNFARVDQDIRDLRGETHRGHEALGTEVRGEMAVLRAELEALRQPMLKIGAGMIGAMSVGFLSLLAAILARGA